MPDPKTTAENPSPKVECCPRCSGPVVPFPECGDEDWYRCTSRTPPKHSRFLCSDLVGGGVFNIRRVLAKKKKDRRQ